MRPWLVVLLIITGSAIAISVSLSMAAVVFWLLPEYAVRLEPERLPLLHGLAWSWALTVIGGFSLIGEIRGRRWRWPVQGVLGVLMVAMAWVFWPS
jgi:hypothetical protein